MKKYIYYILLALGVVMVSCTDDLNQIPHINTQPNAGEVYGDAANYKKVLAKIYASYVIAGQELGGGNADISSVNGYDFLRGYFNLQEAATDEVANTWLQGDKIAGLTYITWDANDPWVSDTYYRTYYSITLCNEFIRNCSDDKISGFSQTEQNEIRTYKAEARFHRAMFYYFVIDLFGKGPFVNENTPIGAYIPEAYSRKQLFEYIESELLAISDQLPPVEYGRVNNAVVWTLLAKLYLNAGVYTGTERYTDCITYCKKVMNAGYSLEPDYAKLFNADNHNRTNEIIFPLIVDSEHTVSWGATTYIACGACGNSSTQDPAKYGLTNGWGMFRVRGELPALFGDVTASKDSRCLFYVDGQTQYLDKAIDDQSCGYFSEKFTNLTDKGEQASNTGAVGVNTDYPMFRLADVYLMLAESVLRGGVGATREEALTLLNLLRERAYGDKSGNIVDTEMSLQYIIDERARELHFECTRRTDLIRFNMFITNEYLWQWKGGVKGGRAVDKKYNVYPIPHAELSANPNLKNENY